MKELSLNVLDIAQNSISAGARLIEISVDEETDKDLLRITVSDDGRGMTEEQARSVTDPFYTTRTTRKVGLGVPLFKMAAEMAGGSFSIRSEPGQGTRLTADFRLSHVDRMPLGDMEGTVQALIHMNPQLDFVYRRRLDGRELLLDTRELKETLGSVPLNAPEVGEWIAGYLAEQAEALNDSETL